MWLSHAHTACFAAVVVIVPPHWPGERRKRGKQDRRSAEIGLVIRGSLEQTIMVELLPRSQIDIYVQVGVTENPLL